MSMIPYRGLSINELPVLRPMRDVLRTLQPADEEVIPVNRVEVADGPLLLVDGEELQLAEEASGSFFKSLNIPFKYADRCPPTILAPQVNHWLANTESARNGSFIATRDSGALVARQFVRDGQGQIPLYALLNALGTQYEDRISVRRMDTDSSRDQEICFVIQDLSWNASLVGGGDGTDTPDMIYGGITVRHSPVGEFATSVEGYLFRLWCANGAIMMAGKGGKVTRHLAGDPSRLEGRFLGAVGEVTDKLGSQFEALAATCQIAAPTADRVLRSLRLLGIRLPNKVAEQFREIMDTNPPRTYYDMINLLTWLAHEYEGNTTAVRRIESFGGALINHHDSCTSCGRIL